MCDSGRKGARRCRAGGRAPCPSWSSPVEKVLFFKITTEWSPPGQIDRPQSFHWSSATQSWKGERLVQEEDCDFTLPFEKEAQLGGRWRQEECAGWQGCKRWSENTNCKDVNSYITWSPVFFTCFIIIVIPFIIITINDCIIMRPTRNTEGEPGVSVQMTPGSG